MTFLNPLAFIGLLATLIPIVFHLINLRKLRTIEFSSLAFLKELQRTQIRKLKIRQLLLLIIRTSLIFFLVLALSRPTIRESHQLLPGSDVQTTAVIIFDDSQSMLTGDNQGSLLRQAKDLANSILTLFDVRDEVIFFPLSTGSHFSNEPSEDKQNPTESAIQEQRSSFIFSPLSGILKKCFPIFSQSVDIQKELYVISDFQESLFDRGTSFDAERLTSFSGASVFLLPLKRKLVENVSVDSIWISNILLQKGKSFSVTVRIVNHGKLNIKNYIVSLFLEGIRVSQQSVDIEKSQYRDVEFSLVADSYGWRDGFVEIEEDEFVFDNKRYFTFYVPNRLKLLLIGQPSDLQYIKLALLTRQTEETVVEVIESTPQGLTSNHFREIDAIILTNIDRLSPTHIPRFREFIEQGGGFLLFPGELLNVESYNQLFSSALKLPTISEKKDVLPFGGKEDFSPSIEIEKIEWRHPIFRGMFEDQREDLQLSEKKERKLESLQIMKLVRYNSHPYSIPIITLSTNDPFLIEQKSGAGKILLFAVSATPDWSDFPIRGLFIPLIHQSISYVSRNHGVSQQSNPGREYNLNNVVSVANSISLIDPDLNETIIPVIRSGISSRHGGSAMIRFVTGDQLGVFTARANNQIIEKFAVNLDELESRISQISEAKIVEYFTRIGFKPNSINIIDSWSELQERVEQNRFGIELWKYFLLIAFLLAILEQIIARSSKKETVT